MVGARAARAGRAARALATTRGSCGLEEGATPSARLRSLGPMKSPATPSTAAICAAFASASAVSTIAQHCTAPLASAK